MRDLNGNEIHLGETVPEQRAREARQRMEADELELTERLELRCTAVDRARFAEAAHARGLSESAFVRLAARELALHPAIARGALESAWLTLAQQGVDTLGRIMAELADRSDLIRTKPVEVQLTVRSASAAAVAVMPKKKPAKRLAMKHASRKKKPARRGR